VKSAYDKALDAVRAGTSTLAEAAAGLLGQLTDSELLGLLDGDLPFWRGLRSFARAYNDVPIVAGEVPRLGIPGIRVTDGPRGVVMGNATCFPVASARGATWDVELEERVGRAIGLEARALGANLFAGVCVNLVRHPGWGRAQESYGEDPLILGRMGSAVTRGVRAQVMACVKHFALNSIEEARFRVDVQVEEDVLHEIYLPHFRAVVDAGADAVMSAYNSVLGTWAGENPMLLTDVLRDEWGFEGFVMTDFVWGLRDPIGSVRAGQDLEMPLRQQRARALPAALRDGRLDRRDVERAALRLLTTQLRHAANLGAAPAAEVVASAAHRALAREVAVRGTVLLRNRAPAGAGPDAPLLPLDPATLRRIAVLGPLADAPNLGDVGSSQVRPPYSVSILEGFRAALGPARVVSDTGSDPAAAAAHARGADAAVVVVGLGADDEGEALVAMEPEAIALMNPPLAWKPVARLTGWLFRLGWLGRRQTGGDRRDLGLPRQQLELISRVAAANPRTIVVVIAGSAVLVDPWQDQIAALLLAWYPGMEGGHAIADIVLGNSEPGGRLPVVIPARPAQLPDFDPGAERVVYDRWWGQRKIDREGGTAAFPLGYGLGYTTYRFGEPTFSGDGTTASLLICNTGRRRGTTVAQAYAVDAAQPVHRRVRYLIGFTRVDLEPGEARLIELRLDLGALRRRDPVTHVWSPAAGTWQAFVGRHSHDDAVQLFPLPLPPAP
jgi:beta-glucosidase